MRAEQLIDIRFAKNVAAVTRTLERFGDPALCFAYEAGVRVVPLRRGQRYADASPALQRLSIAIDDWPAPPVSGIAHFLNCLNGADVLASKRELRGAQTPVYSDTSAIGAEKGAYSATAAHRARKTGGSLLSLTVSKYRRQNATSETVLNSCY